jgi:UDPglucose 6-dehydrogenase
MKIGIIGLGFVGGSIHKSFKLKNIETYGYDRFKESDTFEQCLNTDIVFLCLPTQFNENTKEYDKTIIYDICDKLKNNNYNGLILIKSTIEPSTTDDLTEKFDLKFIHNPEFLTARTAFDDFHNQKHIVLGKNKNIIEKDIDIITNFYKTYYPDAEISICTSIESESMKIFCNCFYSVKIQFFNELYLLCKENNSNYDVIVNLMLKNGWINKMHTVVPGPDGKLSYGGYCFPKDTNALLNYMKKNNSPSDVLEATINERNKMRDDDINIIKN